MASELQSAERLFDVYLRAGFSDPGIPRSRAWLDRISEVGEVNEYPVGQSFTQTCEAIRRGKAPYVVLADDVALINEASISSLRLLLARNRTIPGLTLDAEPLATTYSVACKEPRADSVRQLLLAVDRAPSWFCVLNRALLENSGLLELEYETPEFFLLEIARRLQKAGLHYFLLPETAAIEIRHWVQDLVDKSVGRLAADYRKYRREQGEEAALRDIPPQFRIELIGEMIPRPELIDDLPVVNTAAPKFSVICPAYKSDFFEAMLDSVLSQTWPDWELCILIDGPPPHHLNRILSVLEKHRDDVRVRFKVQKNQGTGPTRRALAQMARGEFILSIDDDDMLFPESLAAFAAAIEQHPETDFFRAGAQMIGLVNRYHPSRPRVLIDNISVDHFEVTQPFLIRRKMLESIGNFQGDDKINGAGEDTILFLKLDRRKERTIIIDQPLYYRRLSTCNQSLSFVVDHAIGHMDTIDSYARPECWASIGRMDWDADQFTNSVLTYVNVRTGDQVVCPTRYFSYQTVGDTSDRPIDLEITSVCNADCPFCPREVLDGKNKHMSMDTVRKLAEHLRLERSSRRVVLCGIGESTLHPKLEEIIQLLTASGAYVCMTTNGTRLNGERFDRLVRCGLREINFSLNAHTAETHKRVMRLKNFNEVTTHLNDIIENHLPKYDDVELHVSFVVCNLNVEEVRDFVGEWRQKNVTQVWLHPVNNRAGLLNPLVKEVDLAPLKHEYRTDPKVTVDIFEHSPQDGNICSIANNLDFISWDGTMRLCAMDYLRLTEFGNIKENRIQEMHLDKVLAFVRGDIAEICRSCSFCPTEMAQRETGQQPMPQIQLVQLEARPPA
jgi:MoaA/NifB/PqqE/SkfB family radical SAM enzyme/glycosyltransferase involved in cell wall biosynthesis